MSTFKTVCATLAGAIVIVLLAATGAIYAGVYDVAASDHHWPVTHWALKKTVQNSVSARAADIETPPLAGQSKILAGAANFQAMCSGCHTPPGGQPSPAARGMYPAPPDLAVSGREMPANKIYWVIKHGIKASGMPAWGATHGEDEMWAMTAFVTHMPDMSGGDYQKLLKTAKARGIGHEHHEGEGHHHGGDAHDAHGHDHGAHDAHDAHDGDADHAEHGHG